MPKELSDLGGWKIRWITGDEVYGNWSILRDAVAMNDLWYVFAVKTNITVQQFTWKSGKKVLKDAQAVGEIVEKLPERKWERISARIGTKGPIFYDWIRVRIQETRDGDEGPEGWLLIRRSIHDPTEMAFYLSNAPESVDLKTLARIASSRFNIEQCFEETKSETGLDEYETRSWVGWHRHITLSMMAHAWLASMTLKKKPRKLSKPDCPGDKTVAGNYFANSASKNSILDPLVEVPEKTKVGVHSVIPSYKVSKTQIGREVCH
jgi:hypothetical protein